MINCILMVKRVIIFSILVFLVVCTNKVYAIDIPSTTQEKYINKISNKFSRTYCNTTKFGISYEGALAFSIGETKKEFRNNKLNETLDYSLLKNKIIENLENNCQIYNFSDEKLNKLKFN